MMNPSEFAYLVRAETRLWWFRGMRRILFGLLDPFARTHPVGRVLEAGCGTGYFARLLEQRYGWRLFPLDLAREGLVHARQAGVGRLAQADVSRLPCRSGAFDVVLSLDVLVHFERGAEALAFQEFARVLAPGGRLVLRVAALDILRSRHSQFIDERQRFTRGRLVRLAGECGIRVLRCTYANSLLLPVALARFRVWEPLLRKPPASGTALVPRWLDRLLYAPLAIESALIGAGVNFPAGQSLILVGEKR